MDTPYSPRPAGAKVRVLIIDDDQRLNALLTDYLLDFGIAVRAATHPQDGLSLFRSETPDLLILDLMLPEMDGLTLCRKLRETSRVPIIMLTARGDVPDRILGLEMGADDYLPKPFEPRELVARIHAILRRDREKQDDSVRIGRLEINRAACSARLDGAPLTLTTAEFELLQLLARNRGRVLTRDRILDEIKGIDWEAYDRSIDVLVSRLRQKLGDNPKQPAFIRTVRGIGYQLLAPAHG